VIFPRNEALANEALAHGGLIRLYRKLSWVSWSLHWSDQNWHGCNSKEIVKEQDAVVPWAELFAMCAGINNTLSQGCYLPVRSCDSLYIYVQEVIVPSQKSRSSG
jgi:hypothetical protein